MNVILLPSLAVEQSLPVGDPRFEHVRGVLRMRVGDSFDVGVANGPRGKAQLVSLDATELRLRITWGERPPLPPDIHLLLGLPRPATARKILQEATTLGVRTLTFFTADRGDPAYARSSLWTGGEWERCCILGAEQAFDTFIPEVRVENTLAAALGHAGGASRWALDNYEGSQRLGQALSAVSGSLTLAFGPERGWSAAERGLLREAGFPLVHLGARVLRLETAVIVALGLAHEALGA